MGLPFLQGNAEFGTKHPTPKSYCSKPLRTAEAGDILVSVRAPVGALNIAAEKCCIGRGLAAVQFPPSDKDFGWYSLQYAVQQFDRLKQGSTFEAINKNDLAGLLLPYPESTERHKIASILSSVDGAIEKTQAVIAQTKVLNNGLKQQLFTRGLPGRHTKFKQTKIGSIPKEWDVVPLESLGANTKWAFADGPFGSNLKTIHFIEKGIPVVQSACVIGDIFRPIDLKYISEKLALELSRSTIRPGDLVLAKIGVNYGAMDFVPIGFPDSVISANCIKMTLNPVIANPTYVKLSLIRYREQGLFNRIAGITAQPALTLKSVRKLCISLPSREEQDRIVNIIRGIEQLHNIEQLNLKSMKICHNALVTELISGKRRIKGKSRG